MINEIKYKGYTICRWFVVLNADGEPIEEFWDNKNDAIKFAKYREGCVVKYAAAEIINDNGDVNPAVYGDTLKEATDKLKKILDNV